MSSLCTLLAAILAVVPVWALRAQDSTADAKLAGRYEPTIEVDEFTHHRTTTVTIAEPYSLHQKASRPSFACGGTVTVKLIASGRPDYVIRVIYSGRDWIFEGMTDMEVIADDTTFSVPTDSAPYRHVHTGGVTEIADFYITADQLRTIGAARHAFKARVSGGDGGPGCTMNFEAGTGATIRQFLAHEIDAPEAITPGSVHVPPPAVMSHSP